MTTILDLGQAHETRGGVKLIKRDTNPSTKILKITFSAISIEILQQKPNDQTKLGSRQTRQSRDTKTDEHDTIVYI